jgi:hypothetical protein
MRSADGNRFINEQVIIGAMTPIVEVDKLGMPTAKRSVIAWHIVAH